MPRRRSPALTDAEARVMAVLWQRQTASVADVVAGLKRKHAVSYSTVQTILRILEAKGYVTHEKVARAFIYTPRVDERLRAAARAEASDDAPVQRLSEPARAQRARGRSKSMRRS